MTDVFARCSSSALLLLLVAGGCVDELAPLEGTTSLRVEVTAPADLGSDNARLDDSVRDIVVTVTAIDAHGEVDTGFSGTVDFFVQYLGSLSPDPETVACKQFGQDCYLDTVDISGGVGEDIALELPRVFGPAFLWAENTRGQGNTFATGTSDTLWYRDPWIADVSTPEDEGALDALERSPLEQKQVVIGASRYGARGRLVVTGAYANNYAVSDVQCADDSGTPPCVAGDYDHVLVFTFSRPDGADGTLIEVGQSLSQIGGAVSEFNGLTEIGFPRTVLRAEPPDEALVPEPTVIDPGWLDTKIELERLESALVAIDNAELCPLDDDFDTYSQWKLDVGRGCNDTFNIVTAGKIPEFDPAAHVGEAMPRVVGTLQPINIGSFHVWIIYPRTMSDITLP